MLLLNMPVAIVFPRKSLGSILATLGCTIESCTLVDVAMTAPMTLEIPEAIKPSGGTIRNFASEFTIVGFGMFTKQMTIRFLTGVIRIERIKHEATYLRSQRRGKRLWQLGQLKETTLLVEFLVESSPASGLELGGSSGPGLELGGSSGPGLELGGSPAPGLELGGLGL